MTFIEPGGRTSVMKSSPLPAPLHTAPSFLNFSFLTAADKFAISRALIPLTLATQPDTGQSFQHWLDQHGQTKNAVERFWKPILISALSEELDLISISAAAQVVRESMKSPAARHMGVPTVPLTDLYNQAGDYIRARGGELHFRRPVETFSADASQVQLQLRDQKENQIRQGGDFDFSAAERNAFDYLVLALPFDALGRVLPDTPESASLREQLTHFETAPITGIHLWFDRQITDLDHAVLLDRTIQWMFHKSRLQNRDLQTRDSQNRDLQTRNLQNHNLQTRNLQNHDLQNRDSQTRDSQTRDLQNRGRAALQGRVSAKEKTGALAPEGSYIELVVSSSKSLIDKSRTEIVDLALAEVREFFPAARAATLVKSTVIKEVNATYSPRPGIDAHRPSAVTAWPRVFLAGDWTATGWPATMEGAVRSGYLAAQALARAAGFKDSHFLSPDLPATGLMRLFS
jgi:uncharacterized protein with NAD-binding domain and iron-sulfur cluster